MKIYVGDRFYKEFSDDDKEDFRIVKIKNENTFRIKYTNILLIYPLFLKH